LSFLCIIKWRFIKCYCDSFPFIITYIKIFTITVEQFFLYNIGRYVIIGINQQHVDIYVLYRDIHIACTISRSRVLAANDSLSQAIALLHTASPLSSPITLKRPCRAYLSPYLRIRVRCIHIQSVIRSIVNQLINSASGALMTARDTTTPRETHLSSVRYPRNTNECIPQYRRNEKYSWFIRI